MAIFFSSIFAGCFEQLALWNLVGSEQLVATCAPALALTLIYSFLVSPQLESEILEKLKYYYIAIIYFICVQVLWP